MKLEIKLFAFLIYRYYCRTVKLVFSCLFIYLSKILLFVVLFDYDLNKFNQLRYNLKNFVVLSKLLHTLYVIYNFSYKAFSEKFSLMNYCFVLEHISQFHHPMNYWFTRLFYCFNTSTCFSVFDSSFFYLVRSTIFYYALTLLCVSYYNTQIWIVERSQQLLFLKSSKSLNNEWNDCITAILFIDIKMYVSFCLLFKQIIFSRSSNPFTSIFKVNSKLSTSRFQKIWTY